MCSGTTEEHKADLSRTTLLIPLNVTIPRDPFCLFALNYFTNIFEIGLDPQPSGQAWSAAPCITHLDQNDITELSAYLDPDKGTLIKNWADVARKLGISEAERIAMRRAYSGGGNPALVFLKALKCNANAGDVSGLIDKCKQMERNDIVIYLTKNFQGKIDSNVSDLSEDQLDKLAQMLTERNCVVKCWKNLASYYNFKRERISKISSSIKDLDAYSPTRLLIEKISSSHPNCKLSYLKTVLQELERNDVAQVIDKLIRKHK